jgi:hypothetical protein
MIANAPANAATPRRDGLGMDIPPREYSGCGLDCRNWLGLKLAGKDFTPLSFACK